MSLKSLTSERIWYYFDEITQIPRPSKKEGEIVEYLSVFSKKHNLDFKVDEAGNVLIKKDATPGFEQVKSVILQSHLDMVCEKNSDSSHNFETDPIETIIDGDWVKAKGTTLGGDDGIGIAASLAVLESETIQHGPIEAFFTADEETGMTGALGLESNFLKSDILLNLDSEDDGELFIGCSGGIDTVGIFNYSKKKSNTDSVGVKISVSGLKGGHSGDDIHKGLGNANKLLTRLLIGATTIYKVRLSVFHGGNLRNAIAREAYANITIKKSKLADLQEYISDNAKLMMAEFSTTEPNLKIESTEIALPKFVINKSAQHGLLNSLNACWHGVRNMSADIPGLVETSSNLASVKFLKDGTIKVETSQRSSVESAKYAMASTIASTFLLGGAKVSHGDGYPGWKPNTDSEILRVTEKAYIDLFKEKPEVKAIHAGLECGLFLTKYPNLDMVSFGPTIRGAHSPDEKMYIPAVKKFWELLVEVLKNIPTK